VEEEKKAARKKSQPFMKNDKMHVGEKVNARFAGSKLGPGAKIEKKSAANKRPRAKNSVLPRKDRLAGKANSLNRGRGAQNQKNHSGGSNFLKTNGEMFCPEGRSRNPEGRSRQN